MHDDGDWDSELGEGLIDTVMYGRGGDWVAVLVVLIGIGLLVWHVYGG